MPHRLILQLILYTIALQKHDILFFECARAMMFLLIHDVPYHILQLRLAIAERPEAVLPLETRQDPPVLLHHDTRLHLDIFDQIA